MAWFYLFRNSAIGTRHHFVLRSNHLTTISGKGRYHHHNANHFKKLSNVMFAALASLSTLAAATAFLSHLEEIPYSKRTHLVLLPRQVSKDLAETTFKRFKKVHGGKILAPTHPTSARVAPIADKVIEALERGLRDNNVWRGPNYASRWMEALKTLLVLCQGKDLKSVGETCRARHVGQYLDHVDCWQVLLVKDPRHIKAATFCHGKILLSTALYEHFKSDAEIAMIIAHEVAHVVARHRAEKMTHFLGLEIVGLFWNNFPVSSMAEKISTLHKSPNLALSRKQELEADYIGMMLMASAGYDPRVAVTVNEKLAELLEDDDDDWDTSAYPSGKVRVQSLTQAQEEAMALYRESAHINSRD